MLSLIEVYLYICTFIRSTMAQIFEYMIWKKKLLEFLLEFLKNVEFITSFEIKS